jgi:hypothetical protein|tara:strand:+ start:214 stop:534 length:321 start_codon:yes stop_codon:yes gene_type:complete
MATFYNASYAEVDDAAYTVVTSTSDSTIVLSVLVANRNGLAAADITAAHKNAAGAIRNYVSFTIPVPADATLELISNKYILPSGNQLVFNSSTSGVLDVAVSYVEV